MKNTTNFIDSTKDMDTPRPGVVDEARSFLEGEPTSMYSNSPDQ